MAKTKLNTSTITALKSALAEEYLALDTYNAVRDELKSNDLDTKIFDNIIKSETQHINTLLKLFKTYGVSTKTVERAEIDTDTIPTTLADAYELGKTLELADGHLYDDLLIQSTNSQVDKTFVKLQSASLENHYVAFDNALNLIGIQDQSQSDLSM